jgi:hypothetical protein
MLRKFRLFIAAFRTLKLHNALFKKVLHSLVIYPFMALHKKGRGTTPALKPFLTMQDSCPAF